MSPHISRHPHTAAPVAARTCGHPRHIGTCSTCQRIQLERWSLQLANAVPARKASA